MTMQTLVVPYPPTINAAWKPWQSRLVKTTKAKQFARGVALFAAKSGVKPIDGPLYVAVELYRPRRAGDIDGPIKCLLDSLNGVAWKDDSQIIRLLVQRFDDKHNPRAEVSWSTENERL